MSYSLDGQEEHGVVIRKRAVPAEVSKDHAVQQEEATYGWFQTLLNKIRGYTAEDAKRLKEAAVRGVEGESAKRVSEARKLDAEAQLLYAESEVKLREAAIKELEYERQLRELEAEPAEAEADRLERIADASERLADAISRIKQMGGSVAFDSEQLEKLLPEETIKQLRAVGDVVDEPRQQ